MTEKEALPLTELISVIHIRFMSVGKLSENEAEKALIAEILNLLNIYRINYC